MALFEYVIVGGVAVVLHGYARMTAGLDLVVDLESSAAKAVAALRRPRISGKIREFIFKKAKNLDI